MCGVIEYDDSDDSDDDDDSDSNIGGSILTYSKYYGIYWRGIVRMK